jgi:glucose-1-phosphate thymidylyltransferase
LKGIILAGGRGTRLSPLTKVISKQLLPVYDKPMIFYPLSVLMLADIREILIISTEKDLECYRELLGTGKDYGISLSYVVQPEPNGLAEAFILGENFIRDDSVCLVLGDNIFYGSDFATKLKEASQNESGATIFAYPVSEPERYGVVTFNENFKVTNIEEKPTNSESNFAIPGLYFYDNGVIDISKNVSPSPRGELEITDVNKVYLEKGLLNVKILGRGFAWLDTGTADSLTDASQFVQTIEKRQGFKISCIEEIAWRKNWINTEELLELAKGYGEVPYGLYLKKLISDI